MCHSPTPNSSKGLIVWREPCFYMRDLLQFWAIAHKMNTSFSSSSHSYFSKSVLGFYSHKPCQTFTGISRVNISKYIKWGYIHIFILAHMVLFDHIETYHLQNFLKKINFNPWLEMENRHPLGGCGVEWALCTTDEQLTIVICSWKAISLGSSAFRCLKFHFWSQGCNLTPLGQQQCPEF